MLTCPSCGRANPAEASFCMGCGGALGATATAHEVRKTVTALFCDLVGSTTLGEQHDPEVLRPLLHDYFVEMRTAVERHGGRVEKFIGDAVSAVFGLPVAHEDDALRACRAGVEMVRRLALLGERSPIPLACRVGITTGEVLVPADGEPLIGDAMNTAARLQATASPGSVVIGEPTWRLVRDAVLAEPLEPLVLKGKAEPVRAYAVREITDAGRRRSGTPFVGRERQLALLSRALGEAVAEAAPVVATVLGDPGIGKSRLLDAFLGGLAGATILRASVPATDEGSSLEPVIALVHAAGGGGGPEDAAARLASLVAGRPDAAALEAALRSLLGLADGTTADSAWAFRRLLETLAEHTPVVVALDDMHWASQALVDLVEDAARWTRGPVLLLCGARLDLLDARPGWGGGLQRSVSITLGPLGRTESGLLADALLGAGIEGLDRAATAGRLVTAAEGNPLFLEQLAAEAVERGAAWDPSTAPTTIRALLDARLDRCSAEVARVLEVASVQGTRFRLEVVGALLPQVGTLEPLLREAEHAHLARETERGAGAFVHALVRETAYRRLPKATRAELHAATAGLLPEDDDELIGIHLERAAALRAELGRPDRELERRAGEHLARTGARAFARLDLASSADPLERAARLLPRGSAARLELVPDLAVTLMENGRADEARTLLEGAVAEADETGSRRHGIRIRLQQLALCVYSVATEDEIRRAIAEGHSLLEELGVIGDDAGLAMGWVVIDYLHWLLGEMASVEDAAGRAVAHAERAGRLREQVQGGMDQAVSLVIGPRPVSEIRERAETRRRSANPIVAAGGEAAAAAAAGLAGDRRGYEEAEARWRQAIEAGGLESCGSDHALAALSHIRLEMGDAVGAEALIREGLDGFERLGDVWVPMHDAWLLAIATARQGRMDEAAVIAEALDERYTWMGVGGAVHRGVALSIARAARGRRDAALDLGAEAVAAARTMDSHLLRTLALEQLASVQQATDTAAAIAKLEEAAAIHAAAGNAVGSARVAAMLDSLRSTREPA